MANGDENEIGAALDAMRARARAAFEAGDLVGYMSIFCPELRYKQINGRTIDRTRLAQDVQKQLGNVKAESASRRESLQLTEGGAVEVLIQDATATVSVVGGLVTREFKIQRKSRNVWKQTSTGWCMVEVEILEELIVGSRIRFGSR